MKENLVNIYKITSFIENILLRTNNKPKYDAETRELVNAWNNINKIWQLI